MGGGCVLGIKNKLHDGDGVLTIGKEGLYGGMDLTELLLSALESWRSIGEQVCELSAKPA